MDENALEAEEGHLNVTTTMPLSINGLHQYLKAGRLVLPRFQRAGVWDEKRKAALALSIRRDLPIGALLVYEPPESKDLTLVDGLQRTSAIRDYLEDPLAYIDAQTLQGGQLEAVVSQVALIATANELDPAPEREDVLQSIQGWMDRAEGLEINQGLDSDSLANALDEDLCLTASDDQKASLRKVANDLIPFVQSEARIGDYPLAIIKYSGPSEELPGIFNKINTGGIPLDTFDAYATEWIAYKAEIKNPEIREIIAKRWAVAKAKGLKVEGWSDGVPTDGYTFWEYLYGLGRLLNTKYPFVFGAMGDDPEGTKTVRSSFYLAALVHGLVPQEKKIRQLPVLLQKYYGTRNFDLSDFESAVLLAAESVNGWMKPLAGMKLNQSDKIASLSQVSMFQALSLVARTAVGKRVPFTWKQRPDGAADWAALKEALPAHFLYEALQNTWSGSGDSSAFSATWDSEQLDPGEDASAIAPEDMRPSRQYLRSLEHKDWSSVLDAWMRREMTGNQRVGRSVSNEAKLLMRYVYSDIPHVWHEQWDFHIDHLLPITRLSDLVRNDVGWPMSAIGNLAILPNHINLQKSDKTAAEYHEVLKTEGNEEFMEVVSYATLIPVAEVMLPTVDGKDEMARDEFEDFLERRQEVVKLRVLKALGVSQDQPETTGDGSKAS